MFFRSLFAGFENATKPARTFARNVMSQIRIQKTRTERASCLAMPMRRGSRGMIYKKEILDKGRKESCQFVRKEYSVCRSLISIRLLISHTCESNLKIMTMSELPGWFETLQHNERNELRGGSWIDLVRYIACHPSTSEQVRRPQIFSRLKFLSLHFYYYPISLLCLKFQHAQ